MKPLPTTLAAGLFALSGTAAFAERPAVVELYTSQGCSSCPPADALLAEELAPRDDVIALELHVTYWDYIGWKDTFGDDAYTARQRAYARYAGKRTVYTPQMIVAGEDHVVGYKPMQLANRIQEAQEAPSTVDLDIRRQGDKLRIEARAESMPDGPCVVHVVRYDPKETVHVRRGENAGRTLTYANIVTDWNRVARWDGTAPLSLSVSAPGDAPVVVLIQQEGTGPILAADRIR